MRTITLDEKEAYQVIVMLHFVREVLLVFSALGISDWEPHEWARRAAMCAQLRDQLADQLC